MESASRPILLLISACSIAFAAIFLVLYLRERDDNSLKAEQIARLSAKVQELEAKPSKQKVREKPSLGSFFNNRKTSSPAETSEANIETKPKDGVNENKFLKTMKEELASDSGWMVERQISNIEKFAVLTEEQRARLKTKYEQEHSQRIDKLSALSQLDYRHLRSSNKTQDFMSLAAGTEPLSDILGEDTARAFREDEKKRVEKREKKKWDQKVFVISRKLSLSEKQEEKVRIALKKAEEEASEQMSDEWENRLNSSSFEEDEGIALLNKQHELRAGVLNRLLKNILTDEQYNQHLAEQVNSPEFPFESF